MTNELETPDESANNIEKNIDKLTNMSNLPWFRQIEKLEIGFVTIDIQDPSSFIVKSL